MVLDVGLEVVGQAVDAGREQRDLHLRRAGVARLALVVRDDFQNKGVGTELLSYVTYLAKKEGLLGFTAEVLVENRPMLHLFEKMGFYIEKRGESGVYELKMQFRGEGS